MDFDTLVDNICVFNSIIIRDKLSIYGNKLYIDEFTMFRPIFRFFNNQNKEKTNSFLIKLIQDMYNELSKFYLLINNKSSYNWNELNIKNLAEYRYYLSEFLNMKNSIEILSDTYKYDISFSKKILSNIKLLKHYEV